METGCPDPLNPDSDGDTLSDGSEVNEGTDPCNADSDGDTIPDDVDPFPLDPEGTEGFIESELRDHAFFIQGLDLGLFTGPNNNANKGRRTALSNRASAAANEVAAGNFMEAIDALNSLLDRVDAVDPPKDWMEESPERDTIANETDDFITLLGFFV